MASVLAKESEDGEESFRPGCAICGKPNAKLKCVKCCANAMLPAALYCSKECQIQGWPRHKETCRLVRAVEEESSETSSQEGAQEAKVMTAWCQSQDMPIAAMCISALELDVHPERASEFAICLHLSKTGHFDAKFAFFANSVTVQPFDALYPPNSRHAATVSKFRPHYGGGTGKEFHVCLHVTLDERKKNLLTAARFPSTAVTAFRRGGGPFSNWLELFQYEIAPPGTKPEPDFHPLRPHQKLNNAHGSYCTFCSRDDVAAKHCSACRSVAYCSDKCQKICWPKHKKQCMFERALKLRCILGMENFICPGKLLAKYTSHPLYDDVIEHNVLMTASDIYFAPRICCARAGDADTVNVFDITVLGEPKTAEFYLVDALPMKHDVVSTRYGEVLQKSDDLASAPDMKWLRTVHVYKDKSGNVVCVIGNEQIIPISYDKQVPDTPPEVWAFQLAIVVADPHATSAKFQGAFSFLPSTRGGSGTAS